jgi:hypothetical protein
MMRAHVIFANTNFWEALEITGSTALEHYVWSTIPSTLPANGKFSVPHFEGKAAVD